eukprot:XP_001709832.1 Hypothetical protein GL50803_35512 [Giardia lamblia ATCC 50803]
MAARKQNRAAPFPHTDDARRVDIGCGCRRCSIARGFRGSVNVLKVEKCVSYTDP